MQLTVTDLRGYQITEDNDDHVLSRIPKKSVVTTFNRSNAIEVFGLQPHERNLYFDELLSRSPELLTPDDQRVLLILMELEQQ